MKTISFFLLIGVLLLLSGSTEPKQAFVNDVSELNWSPTKNAKIQIHRKGVQYFDKSSFVKGLIGISLILIAPMVISELGFSLWLLLKGGTRTR
jgi:hypothetical protein